MAAIAALSPLDGGLLYDKDGNVVGKYDRETGRGLFAHAFFEDMLSCNGCVHERGCEECKRMPRHDLFESAR